MANLRVIFIFLTGLLPVFATAQISTDVKDVQVARQKLQVGTDNTKWVSSIQDTILNPTNRQLVHARGTKNYADTYLGGRRIAPIVPLTGQFYKWNNTTGMWVPADDLGLTTVTTNSTLSGAGTAVSPLSIAQQGAANGQVLKWDGTAWVPSADLGTTYTGGAGIDVTGTVVTNTGDISNTNEIQTLSITGQTLSLSGGGGTVTLPSGGGGGIDTVFTTQRLVGIGTAVNPLDLAAPVLVNSHVVEFKRPAVYGSEFSPITAPRIYFNNTDAVIQTQIMIHNASRGPTLPNTCSISGLYVPGANNIFVITRVSPMLFLVQINP